MPDEIDHVTELLQVELDARVESIRKNAQIPSGEAGDCKNCGEYNPRIIRGLCSFCRDL